MKNSWQWLSELSTFVNWLSFPNWKFDWIRRITTCKWRESACHRSNISSWMTRSCEVSVTSAPHSKMWEYYTSPDVSWESFKVSRHLNSWKNCMLLIIRSVNYLMLVLPGIFRFSTSRVIILTASIRLNIWGGYPVLWISISKIILWFRNSRTIKQYRRSLPTCKSSMMNQSVTVLQTLLN